MSRKKISGLVMVLVPVLIAVLPTIVLAADQSAGKSLYPMIMRIINFSILVFLIVKFARKPVAEFFAGKKVEAQQELEELEEARDQAKSQLNDLKAKLASADQDVKKLLEQIKSTTARGREKILEEARFNAEEIVSQARLASETELAKAKQELTEEFGRLIVARAAELISQSVTPDEHSMLIENAISGMKPA